MVKLIFEKYIKSAYKGQTLSAIQMRELDRCWHAAFFSALNELSAISASLPEETACAILEAMNKECEAKAKEVLQQMYRSN